MDRRLTLEQRITRLEKLVNEEFQLTQDMADELHDLLADALSAHGLRVTSRGLKCVAMPYNQIQIKYKAARYKDIEVYINPHRNSMISLEVGGRLNDHICVSNRLQVQAKAIAKFIKDRIDYIDELSNRPVTRQFY